MAETIVSQTPPQWLLPITEAQPCGPSLEYDADYAMLVARLQRRGEAQYGQFIDSDDLPDWPDIERQCRELLTRTRDINVLIWLCRARVRAAQAAGLAQGLCMLADLLDQWPEHIHPQLMIDGEVDPAVRINALAALCDPDGLLGDIREIAVSNNAMRLLVRDVERGISTATSRGSTPTPQLEAVQQQLSALRLQSLGRTDGPVNLLSQAAQSARRIQRWCTGHLQDQAPTLDDLLRLLQPFETPVVVPEEASPESSVRPEALFSRNPEQGTNPSPLQGRMHAQQSIRTARHWFESHEPSSPVAVLLKQAERMVGRRFAEVADSIPLDLLQKWDAQSPDDISSP